MKPLALLVNPNSGSGEAGAVERELAAYGRRVHTFPVDEPERALEIDPSRVVVAGGDGSIACAAEQALRAVVPLAVVPIGTANDFAGVLGLPRDLAAATRLAATGTRTQALELGRIDNRPFVNVASIGLPPAAAREAKPLKPRLGALAYIFGALRAALAARAVSCRVSAPDGEAFDGRAWQVTVACSGAFGAGSRLAVDPGDGMLDLVVIEAGPRVALVRRAYGLRSGSLESQAGVQTRRAAWFELEVGPDTAFNIDGEICVRSGLVRVTVESSRVEVVVG